MIDHESREILTLPALPPPFAYPRNTEEAMQLARTMIAFAPPVLWTTLEQIVRERYSDVRAPLVVVRAPLTLPGYRHFTGVVDATVLLVDVAQRRRRQPVGIDGEPTTVEHCIFTAGRRAAMCRLAAIRAYLVRVDEHFERRIVRSNAETLWTDDGLRLRAMPACTETLRGVSSDYISVCGVAMQDVDLFHGVIVPAMQVAGCSMRIDRYSFVGGTNDEAMRSVERQLGAVYIDRVRDADDAEA